MTQTFSDPDLDRVDRYQETPDGFFEAVRLATGIMDVAKITCWGDLPSEAFRVFERAGIVLTAEQASLLAEHNDKLSLLRLFVRKSNERPGSKKLSLAVCRGCGGWRLFSAGVPGKCPMCGTKLEVPKPAVSIAKAAEQVTKAAAKDAKDRAKAALDSETPDPGVLDFGDEPGPADTVMTYGPDPTADIEAPEVEPVLDLDYAPAQERGQFEIEDQPGYWEDEEPPQDHFD